jgi:hypothetical protein
MTTMTGEEAGVKEKLEMLRSLAPPSVLPDISPARGEIGSFAGFAFSETPVIGETVCESAISALAGEMSGRTEGGAKERNLSDSSRWRIS